MRRPPSAAGPGRDRLRLDEHWLRPRLRRRGGHARTPFAAVGPPGHRHVAGSGRRVAGPPGATRGAGPSAVVRRRWLWSILSRLDTDIEVAGFGRLFGQR